MTESIEQFLTRARRFLDGTVPPRAGGGRAWGQGDDTIDVFNHVPPEAERRKLAAARAFRKAKSLAGFGWITGPAEFGGAGLTLAHKLAYEDLEATYETPLQSYFDIGLGMVTPTLVAFGADATRERYINALQQGELIACQLFSEPGSGSDLASLRTRAKQVGDEWAVNGQKVWTTGGHLADIGLLLARTDPQAPKHRGLTAFVIEMHQPAVTVRPLRLAGGGTHFSEVFLDDARIPDYQRLGPVNEGWRVALTTLMHERSFGPGNRNAEIVQGVVDTVKHLGSTRDPAARIMIAELLMHHRAVSYSDQRAKAGLAGGALPGPELSMSKLAGSWTLVRAADVMARLLGERILTDTGEWGISRWRSLLLGSPIFRIAGGTDEVMRNIIAERVLGLPKDFAPSD